MNRLVSDRYLLRKMWVRHSLQGEGLGRGQTHQLIRQRHPLSKGGARTATVAGI